MLHKSMLLGVCLAAVVVGCDGKVDGIGGFEQTGGAVAVDAGAQQESSGGGGALATGGSAPGFLQGTGGAFSDFEPVECTMDVSCETLPSDDPGTQVETTLSPPDEVDLESISTDLADIEGLTPDQFAARYPVELADGLSYDPTTALGMDTLQASRLALDEQELAELSERGFVITERETFPNFVYGYELIYAEDLPLFVSADSILHAVHQSYDTLLKQLEVSALIPALGRLIDSMRASFPRAAEAGFSEQALADADLYLTVTASLLHGQVVAPVAGADPDEVNCILQAILAEQGCIAMDLFGWHRSFDFSQFTVRGHYTDTRYPELELYFKAMMWLGRVDFRLLQTDTGGRQWLQRRQLEAAMVLRELIDEEALGDWDLIDKTVGAFVGEHDSMTVTQLDALLGDIGVSDPAELNDVPDKQIAQAIVTGRYGTQRICSHIMVSRSTDTLPLNSSFLLFGQRYIVDSHVFSNVVYDRVACSPWPVCRMMPDPLDAAFGALGNDQAGVLLGPQLEQYEYYPPALAKIRTLVDAHPAEYWEENLYNLWVGALRKLSATSEAADPKAVGLPELAGTEAWGRRLLNTQLSSWAELRHDTLLYAKQSYTTGQPVCEYPDAYVEPYPEFWKALVAFAEHGKSLVAELGLPTGDFAFSVGDYFAHLSEVATLLGDMAERQRTGAPHTEEQIAFINDAVRVQRASGGCGGPPDGQDASGWYAKLFLTPEDRVAFDPSIADVHTQPTTPEGSIIGRVLHVATGMPRFMVVTADTCSGPRAYAGLASSYFERITSDFERQTDEQWSQELLGSTPEDVPWMQDLVVR